MQENKQTNNTVACGRWQTGILGKKVLLVSNRSATVQQQSCIWTPAGQKLNILIVARPPFWNIWETVFTGYSWQGPRIKECIFEGFTIQTFHPVLLKQCLLNLWLDRHYGHCTLVCTPKSWVPDSRICWGLLWHSAGPHMKIYLPRDTRAHHTGTETAHHRVLSLDVVTMSPRSTPIFLSTDIADWSRVRKEGVNSFSYIWASC